MAVSYDKSAERQIFQQILEDLLLHTDLQRSEQYIQHGNTTVLAHSIAVACFSLQLARRLHISVRERELIRGALLHDYFLYDWHEKDNGHRLHGFSHPYTALRNAMEICELTLIEQDIIKKHMFPLTPFPPRYRESILVCIADKVCSTYETLYLCSHMKVYVSGKNRYDQCVKKICSR